MVLCLILNCDQLLGYKSDLTKFFLGLFSFSINNLNCFKIKIIKSGQNSG